VDFTFEIGWIQKLPVKKRRLRMKKKLCRLMLMFVLIPMLFFSAPVFAQNKVVVIPLNKRVEAPLVPFAPLAGVSTANSGYTIGTDTVTDKKTGLMWQKIDDNITRGWGGAMAYCRDLVLPAGGFTDWRLPGVGELESIVDHGADSPAINGSAFPNTYSGHYWSATNYMFSNGYAWDLNFSIGTVFYTSKAAYYYVRCVRRGQ
jgi:hypothetical protein